MLGAAGTVASLTIIDKNRTDTAPAATRLTPPAQRQPEPPPAGTAQEIHAGWMEHIRNPYRRR